MRLRICTQFRIRRSFSLALPLITKEHRTWLTVRDDDVYSFRWGNPEFARAFIKNMPGRIRWPVSTWDRGTVWGREVISTERRSRENLVIRQALVLFMLWGRLSYRSGSARFAFRANDRRAVLTGKGAGDDAAWAEASKVFPEITRFFWGDIDARWFPEACLSHPETLRVFYSAGLCGRRDDAGLGVLRHQHMA